MVWIWTGFVALVLVLLSLDLFVFNRKSHVIKVREALMWSAFWIALALVFNALIYFAYEHHWMGLGTHTSRFHPHGLDGRHAAALFFTGYVIEKSLSVDNLFVIALIFSFFSVPPKYQHRILFWGILGALVMRGVMIGLGAILIERFHWLLYVFGVFMLYTAYRMLFAHSDPDPKNNPVIRIVRRFFPVTSEVNGLHFIVREPPPAGAAAAAGRWALTPLALALIMVETTDLIFAVDSIPAIFAITTDPFLVFTSNIFAILGLRSLYFALAGVMARFEYLEVSLAIILALVGVKMLAKDWLHGIPHISFYMLRAVALILGGGIVASVIAARRKGADAPVAVAADVDTSDPAKTDVRAA